MISASQAPVSIVIMAALVLLIMAVPRLAGSLSELLPDAYLDSRKPNTPLRQEELREIKPQLQQTLDSIQTAHAYASLGIVNMQLASIARSKQGAKLQMLEEARLALRASLTLACANPYTWLNLAEIEAMIAEDSRAVMDALTMSMLTGRSEAELYIPRLNLALRFYNQADSAAQDLIAQQLRAAWIVDRNAVVKLVLQTHKEEVLSSALSYSSGK